MPDPVLHLLAGPNGAGKSTFHRFVLAPATGLEFINADGIASHRSFATETVFSHPSKVALVEAAVAAGYLVTLHVVMLPVDLAVARVSSRVAVGGHDVPIDKIRDRHRRLWAHVASAVPLVDEAIVYDNSAARRPFHVVARFAHGIPVGDTAWPAWTPPEL